MTTPATFEVVDMHTGGEPVRILVAGAPPVVGKDILAKRRFAREQLDHVRRLLMFEPRGHADMYGAWLVEPTLDGADIAVLFMHNEGYSTMCGHAVIALGRYAVDRGIVAASGGTTRVGIECPCGLVVAQVEMRDGRSGAVTFDSVPAFAAMLDAAIDVPGLGRVRYDLAYGGAFYALVVDRALGLDIRSAAVRDVVDRASAVTEAIKAAVPIVHPTQPDLGFLYGTIVTDGGDGRGTPSRNICVFAEREVDRSPTGSGVTARMAAASARGKAAPGDVHRFESLTGAVFTGAIVGSTWCADRPAVTVRVGGRAHYSGEARYRLEDGDTIGAGFLLR
jgi:trans-L-3-hydroxyproline dehydratase